MKSVENAAIVGCWLLFCWKIIHKCKQYKDQTNGRLLTRPVVLVEPLLLNLVAIKLSGRHYLRCCHYFCYCCWLLLLFCCCSGLFEWRLGFVCRTIELLKWPIKLELKGVIRGSNTYAFDQHRPLLAKTTNTTSITITANSNVVNKIPRLLRDRLRCDLTICWRIIAKHFV